jgi:L-2-hydroxyglutarate oxidase LhgO
VDTDLVVIGCGVVGLAITYKFAKEGYSVISLDKESQFGTGVSSRSSEVIHAGIYYEKGSLKALLCLKGKELLYEHCQKYKVNHKKLGKIFIAVNEDEISSLKKLKSQAEDNGLMDLSQLNGSEIKKMEPLLNGSYGLFSPSTGIVDSHGLMQSLVQLSEDYDVIFAYLSPVLNAEPINNGWKINIGGKDPIWIKSKMVINAAGLNAINLSQSIFPERKTPKLEPVKGGYLRLTGRSPFNHIIYPAMIPGQIAERVDATPDLMNSLRFGPSIEKTNGINDFNVSEELIDKFYPSIRRYFPDVNKSKLHLDQAGIRPKIKIDGISNPDFTFSWAPNIGWLDLWGMESPALTASLAISNYTYDLFKNKGLI